MQTFLPFADIQKTAEFLDDKRLGKQRVEAIQIARVLLLPENKKGWINHPAVKMWQGYEPYLIKVYLRAIMDEWKQRGYKNTLSESHYSELNSLVKDKKLIKPRWLNEEFCRSHQSNLIRKFPEYYSKFFSEVRDNSPYLWPVK